MRRSVFLLLGVFVWSLYGYSPPGEVNEFPIETPYVSMEADTLYVNIPGSLGGFVFYKDHYYAFFHRWKKKRGFHKCLDTRMYILNREGKKVRKIPLPDNICLPSAYWMYLKGDSICVVPDDEPFVPFCLDESQWKWKLLPELRVPRYEDEDYVVTSRCCGEWGGCVYFMDKHTGCTYEGQSTCVRLVQKIEGSYYVTNYLGHGVGFSRVVKIDDPREMSLYDPSEKEKYPQDASLQGMEMLVDTACLDMATSFVHKGRLLHIYEDPFGAMQIGVIGENGLESVCSLQNVIGACMLQNIPSDTVQYLSFSTYGESNYRKLKRNRYRDGFMIVTPHKIHLHYLWKR